MKKPKFDVERLLDTLGGPTRAHQKLEKNGHFVSRQTVFKWRSRNSIPVAWAVVIAQVFEEYNGSKLDLTQYINNQVKTN
jgi:hypothetical protein